MTHTPGPWRISKDKSNKHIKIIDNDLYRELANTSGNWFDDDTEQSNARLIAAAPELLEALEMLVNYFVGIGLEDDEDGDPNPEIVKARSAIAKAKGE
jgi:hypothetical protein